MRRSPGVALLLWLAIFAGAGGLHRIYLGRPWSGLLFDSGATTAARFCEGCGAPL